MGVLGFFTNAKRGHRQRRQQLNKEEGKFRPEWAVAGSMLCEPAPHLGVLRMTGFLGHFLPGLLLTGPAEQKHVFHSYYLRHSSMYRSLMSHQIAIKLRACSQYLKKSRTDKLA